MAYQSRYTLAESMCWEHMTPVQQTYLCINGRVLDEYGYGGGPCGNRAEVEVEVGDRPGPRFYCRPCAAKVVT